MAFLSEFSSKKPPIVSHMLIQKSIYLIDSKEQIFNYGFKIQQHGPYSEGLKRDLNLLKQFGFIAIEVDKNKCGFDITITKEGKAKLKELEGKFILSLAQKLTSDLIENLQGNFVTQIESMSTAHYIFSDFKSKKRLKRGNRGVQEVIDAVIELKPHLKQKEVRGALEKLHNMNFLI